MTASVDLIALGSIVCDKCGELIETVQSEKVTIYYSRCKEEKCCNKKA
ncbi:GapA-binding peptide SR1P [Bacillus sp. FJAT-50079]|nr:GapA-binding peptide SR1P [Bacillus sp. FJAT-50079]MBS4208885.1 GapA-binding peptide SR1P [Bacillus sp. FJAT-50079]